MSTQIHPGKTYEVTFIIDADKVADHSGVALSRTFFLKGYDLDAVTQMCRVRWTAVPIAFSDYTHALGWIQRNTVEGE